MSFLMIPKRLSHRAIKNPCATFWDHQELNINGRGDLFSKCLITDYGKEKICEYQISYQVGKRVLRKVPGL